MTNLLFRHQKLRGYVCSCLKMWDLINGLMQNVRRFSARNNLRAMKKGDLAFFYHSNCKEPGIVGTMEVVREHSPDRKSTHHSNLRSKHISSMSLRELTMS